MDEPRRLGGRYELGSVLGRGGMAEVYLAHDTRLGRTVAVKTLRTDLASDPTFQARFRREAQSAASLNHPAIVAVYDTGEDYVDGISIPYIVMEYVEGSTLRELLHTGRKLLPERSLEMTAGILQALEYSHRNGIVHRDIKPANVMLTRTGQVKVMDFGIARAMADSGMTMTQTAAVIGTAQYLSPEQAKGETVDARSDLYSTGCLLYELLTVRPPFVGDSPVAVAYQHVREEPQPPSVFDPEITPAMDAIVLKALTKDRDYRYQSADELRADIERALDGLPVAAPVGAAGYDQYGADPYGNAPTTALAPQEGRTSMLPSMDDGGGYGDYEGGRASRRQPKKRNTSTILLVIAAIVVLIAAYFVGKAVFSGNPPAQKTVPNLTGLSFADAKEQAANVALEVEKGQSKNCDQPKNTVCDQNPDPDTKVDSGTTITVNMSKGPAAIEVPDVVGDQFDDASQTLKGKGFKVERNPVDSDQEPGTVVKQDPVAGSSAKSGDTITLDVAKAKEQATVPDVMGQPFEQAQAALQSAGFQVSQQEQESDQPAGTVIAQTPTGNTTVDKGSTVTLTTAKAKAQPIVPSVAGMTVKDAIKKLQQEGFTWGFNGPSDDNAIVTGQDPTPNNQAAAGTKVTLTTVPAGQQSSDNGGGWQWP